MSMGAFWVIAAAVYAFVVAQHWLGWKGLGVVAAVYGAIYLFEIMVRAGERRRQ